MKKILNLREARGSTTLAQVSEDTGIPISTLNALERGFGKGYSILLKHKVASYFGVDMLALFPEEREKFQIIMGRSKKRTAPQLRKKADSEAEDADDRARS